jgi:hypothetical protein
VGGEKGEGCENCKSTLVFTSLTTMGKHNLNVLASKGQNHSY